MSLFCIPARGPALLCAVLGAALPAHAAPVPDTIAQRSMACSACHAAGERGDPFFPHIAGKPAGYLYNQLRNFRDGRRQYPLMRYMVGHLPDAYLHEIADYFSQLPAAPQPLQPTTAPAALLERGRSLVLQGDPARKIPACTACHGERLSGAEPAIPGLLGLPRDYINAQFGAWKNHSRRAQTPDCMAEIAGRLSDADIGAISGWLGTRAAPRGTRPDAAVRRSMPLVCGSVPP